MQANQSASPPGRGLLAASTASRARDAQFTVAEDAGRDDRGFKPSGIHGTSVNGAMLITPCRRTTSRLTHHGCDRRDRRAQTSGGTNGSNISVIHL
jgi:hypothetical protein